MNNLFFPLFKPKYSQIPNLSSQIPNISSPNTIRYKTSMYLFDVTPRMYKVVYSEK